MLGVGGGVEPSDRALGGSFSQRSNSIFNKDAYNLVLSPHSLGVPGAPPYRDPEHAAERSKRSPYAPGSEYLKVWRTTIQEVG